MFLRCSNSQWLNGFMDEKGLKQKGNHWKQVGNLRFLIRGPALRSLILGFLFIAAFCLRLYGINQPCWTFIRSVSITALCSRGASTSG